MLYIIGRVFEGEIYIMDESLVVWVAVWKILHTVIMGSLNYYGQFKLVDGGELASHA